MNRKVFTLPPTSDFHVHLRDGEMMELVVPTIPAGGVDTVYVMPNLVPPLTEVHPTQTYHSLLHSLSPTTHFLPTLYLHTSLTTETLASAARAGIKGVKVYPAGVTTNSASGVTTSLLSSPFPTTLFSAMQDLGLVLNLHGELPSSPILSAEPEFLPTLRSLHTQFPKLRIVLEHATTAEALEAVRGCGETVAATITAHHLWMTVDDVMGKNLNFCKPVAKGEEDRRALCRAVIERNSKFFFGSDSAPHPLSSKTSPTSAAAGCFTQPYATQLVIGAIEIAVEKGWILEDEVTEKAFAEFLTARGRKFYGLPEKDPVKGKTIKLQKKGERIPRLLERKGDGGEEVGVKVMPFRAGEEVWSLEWIDGEKDEGEGKGIVEEVVVAALGGD